MLSERKWPRRFLRRARRTAMCRDGDRARSTQGRDAVTPQPLRWGVIGTGSIAADFCQALTQSTRCSVANVVGSSPDKAAAFANRFGINAASRQVAELLADAAVDVV